MRRTVLVLTLSALAGAAFAAVGALAAHWWTTRDLPSGNVSYFDDGGPPRRYVDYLPPSLPGIDWARLLVPAAIAGAALALVVAAVVAMLRKRP